MRASARRGGRPFVVEWRDEATALDAAAADGSLVAFHDAFAVSVAFGSMGITLALRIHDEDAAASVTASIRSWRSAPIGAAALSHGENGCPRGRVADPLRARAQGKIMKV